MTNNVVVDGQRCPHGHRIGEPTPRIEVWDDDEHKLASAEYCSTCLMNLVKRDRGGKP